MSNPNSPTDAGTSGLPEARNSPPKSSGYTSHKSKLDKSLHKISEKAIYKPSRTSSTKALEARLDALEGRMAANESRTQSQLDTIQSMLSSLVDSRAAASSNSHVPLGNAVSSSSSLPHSTQFLPFPPPNLPSPSSLFSPGQYSSALFATPSTPALSTPIVSNLASVITSPSLFSSSSANFSSHQPPLPIVTPPTISDQLMSQLKAGERTPLDLQTKIINDEYVDFYDVLFPDASSKYILSFENQSTPMLVKDTKRRDLTETQWNKAFTEFAAIYCKAHPTAVADLFTYQKRILYLMERKANWHYFDVQFRKDKEIAKSSWVDQRSDLYLDCLLHSSSPSFTLPHSPPFSIQSSKVGPRIPSINPPWLLFCI